MTTQIAPAYYAWVITKAFGEGEEEMVGLEGPSNHCFDPMVVQERGVVFRLYDDDGNLCFQGYIIGKYNGFEPLDDWGRGGYGCTEIRYRDYYSEWKPL